MPKTANRRTRASSRDVHTFLKEAEKEIKQRHARGDSASEIANYSIWALRRVAELHGDRSAMLLLSGRLS